MKIAVFYDLPFSGAKRQVYEHVKGLKKIGNVVDVYTTDMGKDIFDPGLVANKKYIYKFTPFTFNTPILKRVKSDFFDTFYSLKKLHQKIAKDIDSKKYDIVLVHTDTHTQAPFLLRFLRTKNVYFCLEPLRNAHEYSLRLKDDISILNRAYENLNRWFRKKIDIENVRSSGHVLTLSLFGRERVIGVYDLYSKISGLGIDETVFKPIEIEKQNRVLFIAAKDSLFGYDLAKEAIEAIDEKIRPKLKVIDWKKNNSERLSDVEIVEIYNQSIVTLSLSRFDTSGLVPLESMACGTPVIALNVGGYREILVNGENGFLVDFSSGEIADKILFLINNKDKAEKMGKCGRDFVLRNWKWKKQVRILNSILRNYAINSVW